MLESVGLCTLHIISILLSVRGGGGGGMAKVSFLGAGGGEALGE